MTRGKVLGIVLLALVAAGAIWFFAADLARQPESTDATSVADQVAPPVAASRKIKATLFYVAPDGVGLLPMERDVLFGQGTLEAGEADPGGSVRDRALLADLRYPDRHEGPRVYVTDHGEAYVDLSGEVVTAHPGGSLNELLTVYTVGRGPDDQPAGSQLGAVAHRRPRGRHAGRARRPPAAPWSRCPLGGAAPARSTRWWAREPGVAGSAARFVARPAESNRPQSANDSERFRWAGGRGDCPRQPGSTTRAKDDQMTRPDNRSPQELRPVRLSAGYLEQAEGSVLIEVGRTRVLCAASVEDRVPPFLRNSGKGWVTAEYSMIPRATATRTPRESTIGKVGGRTNEIQRLIGRSLRTVTRLAELGERTIWIDCDVIQADGGTRTASITGGFVALVLALERLTTRGHSEDDARGRLRRRHQRGNGRAGSAVLDLATRKTPLPAST